MYHAYIDFISNRTNKAPKSLCTATPDTRKHGGANRGQGRKSNVEKAAIGERDGKSTGGGIAKFIVADNSPTVSQPTTEPRRRGPCPIVPDEIFVAEEAELRGDGSCK